MGAPEAKVENYLRKRVKEEHGQIRKLAWLGRRGAPDDFVWWPGPRFAFVECKAPGGVERRRAIRYIDPVLTVEIAGVKYKTLNWSTRGLLLEEFAEPLEIGSFVKTCLSSEEVPGGGRGWAKVVRRMPKRHELALEFPDISTVVLALMHEMKLAGIRPEPG